MISLQQRRGKQDNLDGPPQYFSWSNLSLQINVLKQELVKLGELFVHPCFSMGSVLVIFEVFGVVVFVLFLWDPCWSSVKCSVLWCLFCFSSFFVLRPMLHVSLDCLLLIAPSVFSSENNVFLL